MPALYHIDVAPRFQTGQRVRARNINPVSHTRLPRYTRGRIGVIERTRSVQAFPDSAALGQDNKPQYVYLVRFAARELWSEQASPKDSVYIDLWDDYLDTKGHSLRQVLPVNRRYDGTVRMEQRRPGESP